MGLGSIVKSVTKAVGSVVKTASKSSTLGTILSVASTAATVAGAVQSYKAGKDAADAAEAQAEYLQQIAEKNREIAEKAAADAIRRGGLAQQRSMRDTAQLIGRQRAVLASNGVLVDQGSALDIIANTADIGWEDALIIRDNAQKEADNYLAEAESASQQGVLYAMAGRNTASAARSDANLSLLTGVGQVAQQWYNFSKAR